MTPEHSTAIFDEGFYAEARRSRLENLFAHIDVGQLRGKTILELGCGTGEIGEAFVNLGCQVISVDAQPSYIKALKKKFPGREVHVLDLEQFDPSRFSGIDIVLCFGVLYHIARPETFLGGVAQVADTVFLETVVADSDQAVCQIMEESGPGQSFSGKGCRPSPAWIRQVMACHGFAVRDVSDRRANWGGAYPSVFDWTPRNDGAWIRGRTFLRKMYICQRSGCP